MDNKLWDNTPINVIFTFSSPQNLPEGSSGGGYITVRRYGGFSTIQEITDDHGKRLFRTKLPNQTWGAWAIASAQ